MLNDSGQAQQLSVGKLGDPENYKIGDYQLPQPDNSGIAWVIRLYLYD